jgi:hypothetical protein
LCDFNLACLRIRIPLIQNGLAKTVFTLERLAPRQTLYPTELPCILGNFIVYSYAATSTSGSPKISEHLEQHSRNLEPDADYFHFAKSLFQFYIRTGI